MTLNDLPSDYPIQFKLRTRTACDSGIFSEALLVNFGTDDSGVPSKMLPPSIQIEACNLRFSWQMPDSEGTSAVSKFDVKTRTKSSDGFLSLFEYCGSNHISWSCVVPLRVLKLWSGYSVEAAVSAKND